MAPILVVATNRGITQIRGTNYRYCVLPGESDHGHSCHRVLWPANLLTTCLLQLTLSTFESARVQCLRVLCGVGHCDTVFQVVFQVTTPSASL